MVKTAVLESENTGFCAHLAQELLSRNIPSQLIPWPPLGESADILVWLPGARPPQPAQAMRPHVKALIAYGDDARAALEHCQPDMVVTYGLSTRDTLTPSALLDEGQIVTLQRELVRLDGAIEEPRELPVGALWGDVNRKMAQIAMLLLCGAI